MDVTTPNGRAYFMPHPLLGESAETQVSLGERTCGEESAHAKAKHGGCYSRLRRKVASAQ